MPFTIPPPEEGRRLSRCGLSARCRGRTAKDGEDYSSVTTPRDRCFRSSPARSRSRPRAEGWEHRRTTSQPRSRSSGCSPASWSIWVTSPAGIVPSMDIRVDSPAYVGCVNNGNRARGAICGCCFIRRGRRRVPTVVRARLASPRRFASPPRASVRACIGRGQPHPTSRIRGPAGRRARCVPRRARRLSGSR
jgi:hypothetical protein